MPGGDGTGPMGAGPMTGRGMGYCAVRAGFGFMNRIGFGRGWGCGRGFGMGWRNRVSAFAAGRSMGFGRGRVAWTSEDELSALQQEADAMQADLNDIRSRIEQLKSAQSTKMDE